MGDLNLVIAPICNIESVVTGTPVAVLNTPYATLTDSLPAGSATAAPAPARRALVTRRG